MKNKVAPTVPFVLSTASTGVCCHLSGMTRPDLVIAIIVAGAVSALVAFGCAFANSRKDAKV